MINKLIVFFSLTLVTALRAEGDHDFATVEQVPPYSPLDSYSIDMGLVVNQDGFAGQLALKRWFNPYIGLRQLSSYYRSTSENDGIRDSIHGEVGLGLEVSPLRGYLFEPYLATNAAYHLWRIPGATEDTLAASAETGLSIRMSPAFLLIISHQWLRFVDRAPRLHWQSEVNDLRTQLTLVKLAYQWESQTPTLH